MRRFRRLDLRPVDAVTADFDAHFRDTHVDGEGIETIVHEYTVAGSIDSVDANHHVGHRECPGAALAGVPGRHRKCGPGAGDDTVGTPRPNPQ